MTDTAAPRGRSARTLLPTGLTPRRRKRRAREAQAEVRPVHRRQVRRAGEGRILRHDQSRERKEAGRGRGGDVGRCRSKRCSAARSAHDNVWSKHAREGTRQIHLSHRADDAGSRPRICGDRIDGRRESRSANRAMSMSRSPRRTFSITRAGRTSSNTPSPASSPRRSASRGRSSRGISRC